MLSIGQLSEQTGVSRQTIRYYERIRLLPRPKRQANGYRWYQESDVERLQFIAGARQLGFTLDDIAVMMELGARPKPTCESVLQAITQKMAQIDRQIQTLSRLKAELKVLYASGLNATRDREMKNCVCVRIQRRPNSIKEMP